MASGAAQRTPIESGEFVFSRVIDAPRQRVWRAFTEAEQLAHWWGPKGFKLHVEKLDLRPGGIFLYRMRSASGQEMWGRFVYREITRTGTVGFRGVVFGPSGWHCARPDERDLAAPDAQHRDLLGARRPDNLDDAGPRDRRHRRGAYDLRGRLQSMQAGFGGTFDQLAAYLAKA